MRSCMRSSLSYALVALGLSVGSAAAQGLPPLPSIPQQRTPILLPAVPDWTGFYIGGQIGAEFHSAQYDSQSFNNSTRLGAVDGMARGFYAGFNFQLPIPIVVGAEVNYVRYKTNPPGDSFQLTGPSSDFLESVQDSTTISGRIGYLVTPGTLVYGKRGTAKLKVSGFEGFSTTPFEATLNGTVWGVGIESMITENVVVRVEATRIKTTDPLILNNGADVFRPEISQVMAGAAVKLNPGLPSGSTVQMPAWWPRPPQINRTWTSVFVGGDVGAAGGVVKRLDQVFQNEASFTDFTSVHSFYYGADLQIPQLPFVIGVQYAKTWINANFDDPVGSGTSPSPVFRFATINELRAVTGRFGVLVNPSTLIYGRVGRAHMDVTPSQAYFNLPGSGAGPTTLTALQTGIGAEAWVTDHLAFRIEALYTKARDNIILTGSATPNDTELRPSVTTGTAGLLAKF
jgi:outer membrane immunogenic protein